jgi:hypothetical protein
MRKAFAMAYRASVLRDFSFPFRRTLTDRARDHRSARLLPPIRAYGSGHASTGLSNPALGDYWILSVCPKSHVRVRCSRDSRSSLILRKSDAARIWWARLAALPSIRGELRRANAQEKLWIRLPGVLPGNPKMDSANDTVATPVKDFTANYGSPCT